MQRERGGFSSSRLSLQGKISVARERESEKTGRAGKSLEERIEERMRRRKRERENSSCDRNNFCRERDRARICALEREKKGEEAERKNAGEEGGENKREEKGGDEFNFPPPPFAHTCARREEAGQRVE